MGLFDNYQGDFDPSGGILGRLMSLIGPQAQSYDTPAGVMGAPAFSGAMATAPQPPNGFAGHVDANVKHGVALPPQTSAERAAGVLPGNLAQPQPAVQTPQAQPDIASLLQPQRQAGGLGAALQGAMANFGNPLSMIGGAIAGGMGMGQGTPQQQQTRALNAQYKALIDAGLPKEKALVVLLNPEAAKSILADQFGSDRFTFAQQPDGTIVRENARTGEAAPAYRGAVKPEFGIIKKEDGTETYGWRDPNSRRVYDINGQPLQANAASNSGTVTGPDGKPIAIPPGVDRKTFVNEITKAGADAATGKMTETQAKSSAYAARMEQSEAALRGIENEGASYIGRGLDAVPLVGGTGATNSLQSNAYQKYKQASGNFITALLRQESGAAISKEEFSRYEKEMMPQPGDGPDVIAQKRAARAAAIEQMKKSAGPSYKSSVSLSGGAANTSDPLGLR